VSRGPLDGLASPSPLARALPGLFQDDDLACRLVSAFDAVVAPVFVALDNLPAYLDPGTAPEDFLDWLAGWFGLELEATWSVERRRAALRQVVELYRWRGTNRGLRAELALHLGVQPTIDEDGGVVWSPTPGAELPGTTSNRVVVRVPAVPGGVDAPRVRSMVRAIVPAHLACEVEIEGVEP
jgi:phage tail-like protein